MQFVNPGEIDQRGVVGRVILPKPGSWIKFVTITTVSQKDIRKLLAENKGKADYIICVDEDMTTTY